MSTLKTFEDLACYQKAKDFRRLGMLKIQGIRQNQLDIQDLAIRRRRFYFAVSSGNGKNASYPVYLLILSKEI